MGRHAIPLISLLILGACPGQKNGATTAGPDDDTSARVGQRPAVKPPLTIIPSPLGNRSRHVDSTRGSPHTSAIQHVVLAVDRPAALTQGDLGDIRLWTALDGSVEPIPVPVKGARDLALAGHTRGVRIAIVDTAGSAQLWHYDERTGFAQLFATSPQREFLQLLPLPGGTRTVGLRRDHTVLLLAEDGRELASLSARGFRPMALVATRDPGSIIALSTQTRPRAAAANDAPIRVGSRVDRSSHDVVIAPIRVGPPDRPTLALAGRLEVPVRDVVGAPQIAISADGRRAAFLQSVDPDNFSAKVYAVAIPGGKPRLLADRLPTGRHTDLGFVDERTLVVVGTPEGRAWRIDTAAALASQKNRQGDTRDASAHILATATGASTHGVGTVHSFGQGKHLTGSQRWLHVHDPDAGLGLYLGYRAFSPIWVAFSPSGASVLWVTGDNTAHVEPLEQPDRSVSTFSSVAQNRLARGVFIDERHIVFLDSGGGLMLLDHQTGEVRATADSAGAPVQSLDYDADRNLLHVPRSIHDLWLYRVNPTAADDKRFVGPYILRTEGTMHSGVLTGTEAAVLYTLDHDSKLYRTYSSTEIRSPMSYRAMLARGQKLGEFVDGSSRRAPNDLPAAIDRRGRRYYVDGARLTVYGDTTRLVHTTLQVTDIARVLPSPTGGHFAIQSLRHDVQVYVDDASKRLWSYNTADAVSHLAWSEDGTMLAIATVSGGLILDARTGVPIHRACGPWFDPRVGAPSRHNSSGETSATCGL